MENIIEMFAKCIKERYCETDSENYSLYVTCLINLTKKDGNKPQIVKHDEFNSLNTITIYRGINATESDFVQYKNDFAFGDFQRDFLSKNVYGVGLYFSDNERTAQHYSNSKDNIITVKLTPGAKVLTTNQMKALIQNSYKFLRHYITSVFGQYLDSSDIDYYMQRIHSLNEGLFVGKLLNIDGIISGVEMYGTNYIIFNRNALVANEDDFSYKKSDNTQPGEDE